MARITISNCHDNNSDLTYVLFDSPQSSSDDKTLKFLIDTGAAISLIKATSLTKFQILNDKPIILNGISPNSPIHTLGDTELQLSYHDNSINAIMHVINADTNIPFDGLLGDDFFRGQEAKIDYSYSSISTKSFPFPIPVHRNTPQFPKSTLMLNPRTEMVSSIKIINPQNLKEGIVVSQQLGADNSILIPNAVVKVRNDNTAITTLINTSVTKQTIPCPELHIIPLPEQAYINKITTGKWKYNHVPNF